jgi:hypothetical protein
MDIIIIDAPMSGCCWTPPRTTGTLQFITSEGCWVVGEALLGLLFDVMAAVRQMNSRLNKHSVQRQEHSQQHKAKYITIFIAHVIGTIAHCVRQKSDQSILWWWLDNPPVNEDLMPRTTESVHLSNCFELRCRNLLFVRLLGRLRSDAELIQSGFRSYNDGLKGAELGRQILKLAPQAQAETLTDCEGMVERTYWEEAVPGARVFFAPCEPSLPRTITPRFL